MILKNSYGCTLVLDALPNEDALQETFAGSSLQRKKYRKILNKYDLDIQEVKQRLENERIKKEANASKPVKTYSMSQRTRVKIRKKLIAFSRLHQKLNFLTLTFVNKVEDEKAILVLRKFLDNTKKRKENFQYIWVAERQNKNPEFKGNIHFHIITNKSWDIDKYWNYWLKLQFDAGIKPREENFKATSAFDIKRINKANMKAIQLYITKYISKNRDEFKCQVWNCSKGVSRLYTDFYSNVDFLDTAYKLERDQIHEAYSERCTLHFIPLNQRSIKLYERLDNVNLETVK